jgi:hypothetical protein
VLFALYERVDARLYGRPDDAFASRDVSGLVAGVRSLDVVPLRPKPFEHRFDDATIAALRAEDLDVVLRLGFGIIRGEILDVARAGVWSFHHGDPDHYRGGPAGFWEMHRRDPVTGTVLQRLTEELDGGAVLARSFAATDRSSLRRGRSSAYLKSTAFVERRLRDLYEHGPEGLDGEPPASHGVPIARAPRNGAMVGFLARIWGGIVLRAMRRRFSRDTWFVAFRRCRSPGGPPVEPGGFTELQPPPGHFFADPFLLEHDERAWLFYEDYDWSLGRAGIAAVEVLGDGRASAPRRVLDRPYHLSYPFVIEVDGEVLLIPESAAAGRVEAFRAVELPDRWEPAFVLLDGVEAYDPTLLHHGGRWWLFVTCPVPGASPDDDLHVYVADAVAGPWTPHPGNPVVSDVRCARPAGRIVERDGRLFRPGQDGSVRYGGAIEWREIVALTGTAYEERPVHRTDQAVLPRNHATHTYDHSTAWEVLDGQRRVRRR